MLAVLYEDSQGERDGFGLHHVICRCVLDRLPGIGRDVYHLKNQVVKGIPLNSNNKVLRKCRQDLKRLSDSCRKIIAVYDQDRLSNLLQWKGLQCRSLFRAELAKGCEPKEYLEIVLINRNLESVIETIRDSGLATFVAADIFAKALDKKQDDRDRLFIKCAEQSTKDLRDKLLELLPDVSRLVAKIVEFSQPVK